MFDPNQHKPDPSKKKDFDDTPLERAGLFLIAPVYMKAMETSSNGNGFKRTKFEVIGEAAKSGVIEKNAKGLSFWDSIFFSTGAHARLGAMCASMGIAEPFDTTSDSDIERVMLGQPFKARIKIESRDGKKYAQLAFSEQGYTEEEKLAMDKWSIIYAENRDARRRSGGGSGGSAEGDGSPMPDDSDLDDFGGF